MTTRYSRGKIYKLVNSVDDKIYIGSTCIRLSQRLHQHKSTARIKPAQVHRHLNTIGWDNVRIILIENVIAETKDQLLQREQHYIDLLNPSLNKHSAYVHCPHGREHPSRCPLCLGHPVNKDKCSRCKKSYISEDNLQTCLDCRYYSECSHGFRLKSDCKECNKEVRDIYRKTYKCSHGKRPDSCKECNICIHDKHKSKCKECNGDTYYCYECEKSFCNQQNLTYHNNSERHKKTYNRLMKEVFEDD